MRDELGRLLEGIPRETAPEIPLDGLIRRATLARFRGFAFAGIGLVALSAVGFILTDQEAAPAPARVHRTIHVVDSDAFERAAEASTPTVPGSTQPEEFDRP